MPFFHILLQSQENALWFDWRKVTLVADMEPIRRADALSGLDTKAGCDTLEMPLGERDSSPSPRQLYSFQRSGSSAETQQAVWLVCAAYVSDGSTIRAKTGAKSEGISK
jgi:hypothetical protein